MQILPSGNVLLGFGYSAAWTEFTPEGKALCDVHIGSQATFNTGAVQTYKVLKHPWAGKPITKPAVKYFEALIYMSWNGATEIANWVLQSSKDGVLEVTSLVDIEMTAKTGFETMLNVDCHRWPYVRAVAVDAKGETLGASEMIETGCEVCLYATSLQQPLS
jgi:hypothetical protein